MTIEYPYHAPIILTDTLYVQWGGHTGTSTAAQRQGAYLVAEKQMTSQLDTFLLPTIVTGTYSWPLPGSHIPLGYCYVNRILSVTLLDQKNLTTCDLQENVGGAFIWSDTYGYIDPRRIGSYCNCSNGVPYQLRVAFDVGLPSGTSYDPDVLIALAIAAEITLNEVIDPSANEGVGDVGIQEFSNQQYNEKRIKLGRNAFGTSARAQKAAQLVNHLRRKRALSLRW